MTTELPGCSTSICALRAVSKMHPVSSPIRASATFTLLPSGLCLSTTTFVLTTLTYKLCPDVPGCSWPTVTNTGATVVGGQVGTVDESISGFPPGVSAGLVAGSAAASAHADAFSAWDALRALNATASLKDTALDVDTTLTPGVYVYEQGASIAATITLSGAGAFVFQIPSELSTTNGSQVLLTGGAVASNVFWAAGGNAVLGADSVFAGTIITHSRIALGEGAVTDGGLFAGTSITLAENTVTV